MVQPLDAVFERIGDDLRYEARHNDRVRPLITRRTPVRPHGKVQRIKAEGTDDSLGGSSTDSNPWERCIVRPATEADIDELTKGLGSRDELRWLGGESFDSFRHAMEYFFKEESIAPMVLTLDEQPVAFTNVQDLAAEAQLFEVGRTFVVDSQRQQGLGSVVLRHVADSVARSLATAGYPHASVIMRTSPDNPAGVALMHTMTTDRVPAPPMLSRESAQRYNFYRYRMHYAPSALGDVMKAVRHEANLSLSKLAFRTGISEHMLRKIESGAKQPSLDALRAIVLALSTNDETRVRLLMGVLGESVSDRVVFQDSIDRGADPRINVWVFTDSVAELLFGDTVADTTAAALDLGRDRHYFLPSASAHALSTALVQVVRKALSRRAVEPHRAERLIRDYFRVYAAPDALCQLRIEVRNPSATSAELMTVEGPGRHRVPVSQSTTEQFVKNVRETVALVTTTGQTQSGFSNISIEPKEYP